MSFMLLLDYTGEQPDNEIEISAMLHKLQASLICDITRQPVEKGKLVSRIPEAGKTLWVSHVPWAGKTLWLL